MLKIECHDSALGFWEFSRDPRLPTTSALSLLPFLNNEDKQKLVLLNKTIVS